MYMLHVCCYINGVYHADGIHDSCDASTDALAVRHLTNPAKLVLLKGLYDEITFTITKGDRRVKRWEWSETGDLSDAAYKRLTVSACGGVN